MEIHLQTHKLRKEWFKSRIHNFFMYAKIFSTSN